MSPQTVTGHRTGCTFHSSMRMAFACSHSALTSPSARCLHSRSCAICRSRSPCDDGILSPAPQGGEEEEEALLGAPGPAERRRRRSPPARRVGERARVCGGSGVGGGGGGSKVYRKTRHWVVWSLVVMEGSKCNYVMLLLQSTTVQVSWSK
uniref:Uncharacterized protein n=1 Tax=Oryza meridionalis TaxID=40149 RepID=A0A0E0CHZ3_9ORYZ